MGQRPTLEINLVRPPAKLFQSNEKKVTARDIGVTSCDHKGSFYCVVVVVVVAAAVVVVLITQIKFRSTYQ